MKEKKLYNPRFNGELPLDEGFSTKGAILSQDMKYRYTLYRRWDDKLSMVMFLMLNPSTADESEDDPTIRRCISFAKSWGYGGLYVGNLFALRATDPKELRSKDVGNPEDNLLFIKDMATKSDKIICAWGNTPIKCNWEFPDELKSKLHCLAITKLGHPKHPLYLKKDLTPIPFEL